MASFKVPCLSCEYLVPIKDPKLIGTKVECPKCKYRFKVEQPKEGAGEDAKDAAADKKNEKKAASSGDDAAKKKKKMRTIGAIAAGVVAVGVLIVVAMNLGGGSGKTAPGKGGGGGGGGPRNISNAGGTGAQTGTGGNSGDPDETQAKKDGPPPIVTPPKRVLPVSDKQTTNLLPPNTVSLLRVDLDRLHYTHTSLNPLFDRTVAAMFESSFGFGLGNVSVYYHAVVGDARAPFGLMRLKDPVDEKEVLAQMALAPGVKKVRGYNLHSFRANPFIEAIADSLSPSSLFRGVFVAMPQGPASAPASRVVGVCVYDTQHVLVGDRDLLERFLSELNKGYPNFQSIVSSSGADTKLALAEKDMYLSIDPFLKKVLKSLDSEAETPPAIIYGEKYAQGTYDPKLLRREYQLAAGVIDPILQKTVYLGVKCPKFTANEFTGTLRLWLQEPGAAFEAAKDQLSPALPFVTMAISEHIQTPVQFRNSTPGAATAPDGTPPFGPGQPGVGFPRPPGAPGMQPGPGPNNMRPGPGRPGPGTTMPGQPGQPSGAEPKGATDPSHLDLRVADAVITLDLTLHWTNEVYATIIYPDLVKVMNGLKGQFAVHASDIPYYALAPAVKRMVGEKKAFPRGTADRPLLDGDRKGLKYLPATRVSFFADLLPYLNGGVGYQFPIQRELAWYEGANLTAAESWVPELLVPGYPTSSWRATSPFVPGGKQLGATNYVAVAGVGVDAARYDPKKEPKKVGIVGYDWGSNVNEVTDGLSNTIFLMQTPPGVPQPWLAGGGATIRGLNEADPMQGFRHKYNANGQEGTYALMGDGSVRFIKGNISPEVLKAMATRAGGETLAGIDTEAPIYGGAKRDVELRTDPKLTPPAPKPDAPKPDVPKGADVKGADAKGPDAKGPDAKGPDAKKPADAPMDPKKKADAPMEAKKPADPPVKEPAPTSKFEVAPEPRAK